jgi:hypothetical protein
MQPTTTYFNLKRIQEVSGTNTSSEQQEFPQAASVTAKINERNIYIDSSIAGLWSDPRHAQIQADRSSERPEET